MDKSQVQAMMNRTDRKQRWEGQCNMVINKTTHFALYILFVLMFWMTYKYVFCIIMYLQMFSDCSVM